MNTNKTPKTLKIVVVQQATVRPAQDFCPYLVDFPSEPRQ